MLDLNKLEEQFDRMFQEETPESFEKWLIDKRTKEFLSKNTLFKEGESYIDLSMQNANGSQPTIKIKDSKTETTLNQTHYALAA